MFPAISPTKIARTVLLLTTLALTAAGCKSLLSMPLSSKSNSSSTAQPAAGNNAPATSSGTSSAHCCVNKAYYSCPSAAAAKQCIGEPMRMMSCVSKCPMGSSTCEPQCMKSYGPDPSSCQRQPAQDTGCRR